MHKSHRASIWRILMYLVLALFFLWTVIPIVLVISSSIKPTLQIKEIPPVFLFEPTMTHYNTDMMDWRRFWLDNLSDWMKWRADAARRGAPGKIIQSHSAFSGYMGALNRGGLGNELADEFLLTRHVDVYGLSSFPLWLMGEDHVLGHLINAEIIAEAAGDKPFYQVELQGGAGKTGLLGGQVPSEADIRQWNWNVIAAGGKGVVYWQYAPEPAGLESPGFGLTDFSGGDTPRALSASRCAQMFRRDDLAQAVRVPAVNGIYLSRSTALLCYAAQEDALNCMGFSGIYRLLFDAGVPVRFVHEDTMEKAVAQGLRVLYLPMALALGEDEKTRLLSFVENGGRLILEAGTGIYQTNGELDLACTFLRDLMGMTRVAVAKMPEGRVTVTLADGRGGFDCAHYSQMFEAYDGQVLARFEDGSPAALRRDIGNGSAVWLGGFVGAAYDENPDAQTRAFIVSLCDARGYDLLEVLEPDGLLVRVLKNAGAHLIVAVNHTGDEKTFCARTKAGGTVTARVPPRDGRIIPV